MPGSSRSSSRTTAPGSRPLRKLAEQILCATAPLAIWIARSGRNQASAAAAMINIVNDVTKAHRGRTAHLPNLQVRISELGSLVAPIHETGWPNLQFCRSFRPISVALADRCWHSRPASVPSREPIGLRQVVSRHPRSDWKRTTGLESQPLISPTMPGPRVLPGASARAGDGALAGPLSGRDLVRIALMMPDTALRAGERSGGLTGAVRAVAAAFIDAAGRSRPTRGPAARLGRGNRHCQRERRSHAQDPAIHHDLLTSSATSKVADAANDGRRYLLRFCTAGSEYFNLLQSGFCRLSAAAMSRQSHR